MCECLWIEILDQNHDPLILPGNAHPVKKKLVHTLLLFFIIIVLNIEGLDADLEFLFFIVGKSLKLF